MGLKTVTGSWGDAGSVLDTITISPTYARDGCIHVAVLTCCFSSFALRWKRKAVDTGAPLANSDQSLSPTTHYYEVQSGASPAAGVVAGAVVVTGVDIVKIGSSCSGELVKMKVGIVLCEATMNLCSTPDAGGVSCVQAT